MYRLFIFIIIGCFVFAVEKVPAFLDIKVRNSEAQLEIDKLKLEFIADRDAIGGQYDKQISELKRQKRSEIRNIKFSYHEKFSALSKKYPEVERLSIKKTIAPDIDKPVRGRLKDKKKNRRVRKDKRGKLNKID